MGAAGVVILGLIMRRFRWGNFSQALIESGKVTKALNPEIPIGVIFRGAMPFVIATFIAMIVFFFVPNINTWLPGIIK
jgi:TRAP-type mannitol/chloroaromatic compound transport system permease large subunit